ncbi:MAG: hypothetical protein KJN68_13010, partial [Bacteroidia bacterium]|nr:hypothetical protein [Bacteroidia bacterium]
MKNILLTMAVLLSGFGFAQDNQAFVQNNTRALGSAASSDLRAQGSAALFINPAREVDGSVYKFEDWENTAVIHTNDNQRFMLRNINLNLQRHT